MDSYYTLLDVPADATGEQIAQTYEQQRERYSPARVAELDAEFKRIATERSAALEHAYAVLADPERRQAYDRSLGLGVAPVAARQIKRRVSRREWTMLGGGVLLGLIVIVAVWMLTARNAQPGLPPIAEVDRPAPALALATLDGTPVNLSDYRGKTVLLNFWYTDCPPCIEETPALQRAYQELSDDGLVILGVNVRRNERPGADGDDDIRAFVNQYGVTYPVVIDADRDAGSAYQIYVLPTSIFIAPDGRERFRSFSAITTEDVERIFTQLQREAAATSPKE